mmetsp:Transcript_20327/g.32736  ORF Transcript_20327/g.32736 Transcript_20327/m.32736 type:complete len:122 (-) Transcript_20327:803-1168(-)
MINFMIFMTGCCQVIGAKNLQQHYSNMKLRKRKPPNAIPTFNFEIEWAPAGRSERVGGAVGGDPVPPLGAGAGVGEVPLEGLVGGSLGAATVGAASPQSGSGTPSDVTIQVQFFSALFASI